jgi:amylosucrase
LQVIAPGVVFLAEAIVAPQEITKYFGLGRMKGNECEIAYNATLMALLWDAIATKKTKLLNKSLHHLPKKPEETTWINYLRCHDDIGLGFDDHYIHEIGWNPKEHRKFLLDYYCQNIEWSPAKGELFMYNPKTGDGRITGSCASLLGLEKALGQNDKAQISQAIDKIIMMHGIIMSYGGIPFIYAGDEIGTLNDYSYLKEDDKKEDSRWINRPYHDWETIARLYNGKTPQSKIFFAIQQLIQLRKQNQAFADSNNLVFYDDPNPHVFIYERTSADSKGVLVICNFDDAPQSVDQISLGAYSETKRSIDLISGRKMTFINGKLALQPYQLYWLAKI